MGEPTVNGEVPSSLFFSHLSSYPVVSQSVSRMKRNSYGHIPFDMADQGYNYAKPWMGYFKQLGPYIAKVDSLGNEGLNRVDGTFPIVKEKPENIKGSFVTLVTSPIRLAGDRKQHLMDVYKYQCSRTGDDSYVARGKAVVATGLKATSESLEWLCAYLIPEAQQNGQPNAHTAQDGRQKEK